MPIGIYIRKPFTEEAKKNMGIAHMGIIHSNESREKMKLSFTDERRNKISKRHMGNKYCLGRKLSEEHKNKISLGCRGRVMSKEQKEKLILINKGKKMSLETRLKMSQAKKGKPTWNKGKHLSEKHRKNLSLNQKGKHFASKETRLKMSLARKGGGWNWKGGIAPINEQIRHSFRYREWSIGCMKRDNFTCQKCGKVGGKLEVHHCKKLFSELVEEARQFSPLLGIYGAVMVYELMWDMSNGVTLCKKCHKNIKHHWKKFVKALEK